LLLAVLFRLQFRGPSEVNIWTAFKCRGQWDFGDANKYRNYPHVNEETRHLYIALAILATAASFVLLVAPAHARTWAGPVDMRDVCIKAQAKAGQANDQYGKWLPNTGDKTNPSAFDWVCTDNHGYGTTNLDIDGWCKDTYKSQPNAYADPQGRGPYDWGCYYA